MFRRWATAHGVDPLPASGEVVALYLASLASEGRKTSTVARSLAAIVHVHRENGHPSPRDSVRVRQVFRGIRRRVGGEQTPKMALSRDELRKMVATCAEDVHGRRDRVILTLGLSSGLRRAEMVALDVADVRFVEEGAVLSVRTSKTEQERRGRSLGVRFDEDEDLCAVRALRHWLDLAGIAEGPIFRPVSRAGRVLPRRANDKLVERVVKASAKMAGLDPKMVAGHSLRSACASAMAAAGEGEIAIMRRLGHATVTQSARYARTTNVF
jgi:site-specific recombinase XerD